MTETVESMQQSILLTFIKVLKRSDSPIFRLHFSHMRLFKPPLTKSKLLRHIKLSFIMRSGGHTFISETTDINDGVLITFDMLRKIDFNIIDDQRVVKIAFGYR